MLPVNIALNIGLNIFYDKIYFKIISIILIILNLFFIIFLKRSKFSREKKEIEKIKEKEISLNKELIKIKENKLEELEKIKDKLARRN